VAEVAGVWDAAEGDPERRPQGLLAGREDRLAAATGLLDALLLGRGGVLWIDGDPGMGKTALVDALATSAERRGATVLRAAGDELIEDFPLRLMAECLDVSGRSADPARTEIAALLRGGSPAASYPWPGEDGADLDAARAGDPLLAARERMLALVEELCARGPVLLAAEDLQWSDGLSLRVWGRLARAAGRMPLLLVGTARPAPRRAVLDLLRALAGGSGFEDAGFAAAHAALELPPLTDAETARLAEAVAGAEPGPRLRTELARAGGNPLYIRTLLDALLGEGLVTVAPAEPAQSPVPSTCAQTAPSTRAQTVPSTPPAPVDAPPPARETAEFTGPSGVTPAAVADVIGRRLGPLPDETISLLRLAALLGARFDPAQLAAVAAADPAAVSRALTAAEHAGVLGGGDRPAFANELFRQVLTRQIPTSVRRTLHGHVARTLVVLGEADGVVVPHLHAAGAELEAWAVDWLARVPQPVLDAMPSAAAPLLRRAMRAAELADEPTDPARARRRALAARLAGVLYAAGLGEEAFEVARRLAGDAENGELAARMTELAVRAVLRIGRWPEVVELAREALAEPGLPRRWRARVRALSSVAFGRLGETEQARSAAAGALAEARASGDPLAVALAHHAASLAAPQATALEHNAAAFAELGDDAESAELRVVLTTNRMVWLYEQGDREGYRRLLSGLLRPGGGVDPMRTGMVRRLAAVVAHRSGDWDEALSLLDGIDPRHAPPPELALAQGLRALIHVHRGERERAARALAAAERASAGTAQAAASGDPLSTARAAAAEANGEPERALELLAALLDAPRKGFALPDDQAPVLVRLALAAGDGGPALAATQGLERKAAEEPSPRRVAMARWCRGQVDDDPRELLAVAETMAAAGWPFDSAGARQDAAVRLAVGGRGRAADPARARAALNAAVRLYSAMGAQWDIRRADASLRAHGVRRGPRSAHRRETTGWGALTASEQRIALLVGQGWSNPDIAAELMLSRHTVQTHVSNILGKLQLASRIEIVRAVAEHAAAG
jgi:DNA-binding NarL/FixJ family response regulator